MRKRLISAILAILMLMTVIPMSVFAASDVLTVGSKGKDVRFIQQKLYDLGYLTAKPDGIFGEKTRDAVIVFQAYNGLESPDGKVGNWTRNVLNNSPVAYTVLKKGVVLLSEERIAVRNIQKRLASLGYLRATPDGSYGNLTYQAVVKFQKANGIYADGSVGRVTAAKLYSNPERYTIKLSRTLCYGNVGDDVKEVQEALVDYGFLNVTPDGSYGPITEAAVKLFQAFNGLKNPDGMVGNWTVGKLNGTPYTFESITNGVRNSVKVMQTYLKDLGYLFATPDGIYGAKSAEAVRKFQLANGISTSDGLNLYTLLKIFSRNNVDAGEAALIGVGNYLHERFNFVDWSNPPAPMYYSAKQSTDTEYVIDFRSYTSAHTYFYVNKQTGKTRMVDYMPGFILIGESSETFNVYDYM